MLLVASGHSALQIGPLEKGNSPPQCQVGRVLGGPPHVLIQGDGVAVWQAVHLLVHLVTGLECCLGSEGPSHIV